MESQSADGERKPGPFLVILNALEVAFRHLPGKLFIKKKQSQRKIYLAKPQGAGLQREKRTALHGSCRFWLSPTDPTGEGARGRPELGHRVHPGAARSRGHMPPVCSQDRTQDPIPWAQEASRLLATHPVRLRTIIHPSRDTSPLPSPLKIR